MAKNSAEDVLKAVPLFEGLSKGELKDVAAQAREELYSPGQDIVTEGQAGGPFFCITEGRADVLVGDKKVGDLRPGSAFGEMALLEGSKRSATIRARDAREGARDHVLELPRAPAGQLGPHEEDPRDAEQARSATSRRTITDAQAQAVRTTTQVRRRAARPHDARRRTARRRRRSARPRRRPRLRVEVEDEARLRLRRGQDGHEVPPRRQGREPRRDDEPRPARPARVHDLDRRVPQLHGDREDPGRA